MATAALLLTAGPRLGAPSLLPEESSYVAQQLEHLVALSMRWGVEPETLVRLPSLAAVSLACLVLAATFAGADRLWTIVLLFAWSPGLLALARHAGTEPLTTMLVAVGAALAIGGKRQRLWLGGTIAFAAIASEIAAPLPAAERLAGALGGLWGAWLGPALPPWRPDVVVPALVIALPLAWLGAGNSWWRRALSLFALTMVAAALGLTAPRLGLAPLRGAVLAPVTAVLLLRGLERLPAVVPRYVLAAFAMTASLIALLNLQRERDLLDSARTVLWDEQGRMLGVLCADDALLLARPALPASLRIYAGRLATDEWDLPARRPARAIVVSAGLEGGLARPASSLERELEEDGYALAGELESGAVPPPLRATLERLTGLTTAPAYLRIRRFERRESHEEPGHLPQP